MPKCTFPCKEHPDLVERVHNASDACLLVVGSGAYRTPHNLLSSQYWNHGQNHYVFDTVSIKYGTKLYKTGTLYTGVTRDESLSLILEIRSNHSTALPMSSEAESKAGNISIGRLLRGKSFLLLILVLLSLLLVFAWERAC